MVVALDPAAAHSGASSLLVSGEQRGAWNYVGHTLQQPVLPASKYRLSGWMLVEQLEPTSRPPYLKIGVHDAEGKFLTNYNTNTYDVSQLGTWQQLVTYCETSGEAALGYVAIEKGVLELAIEATIRIDDVELTLLASP